MLTRQRCARRACVRGCAGACISTRVRAVCPWVRAFLRACACLCVRARTVEPGGGSAQLGWGLRRGVCPRQGCGRRRFCAAAHAPAGACRGARSRAFPFYHVPFSTRQLPAPCRTPGPTPRLQYPAGARSRALPCYPLPATSVLAPRAEPDPRLAPAPQTFVQQAAALGLLSSKQLSRLEVVECDLMDGEDALAAALGNAGRVS